MTKILTLTRPLIGFDLETTGTDIMKDKVVEISLVILSPGASEPTVITRRVNPGIPIPAEATKIHGITDEDVKDHPTFRQIAKSLREIISNGDLATYNGDQFDIPLLAREFGEAGMEWDPIANEQHCIDVKQLYTRLERRRLVDAVKLYLGEDQEEAHAAENDTIYTLRVLQAMPNHYSDKEVPTTVAELAAFGGNGQTRVDLGGKFYYDEEGDICFNFGKDRGTKVKTNRGFIQWMLKPGQKFHPSTVAWCHKILNGVTRREETAPVELEAQ